MKTFNLFLLAFVLGLSANAQAKVNETATPVGTSKIWGMLDNVSIAGLVEGPATAESPLQIICVFEYTEGDIYNSPPALPPASNGLVHLDQALDGWFTKIRENNLFSGHRYETLLLTPPQGSIRSEKLLFIGLGDRKSFNPELMIEVGKVASREALKIGVTNFAISSDLKDAGIDSPTALVAGNIVRGIISEYRNLEFLRVSNLLSYKPLSIVYLLAGQSFFTVAGEGIKDAISSLEKQTNLNN